MDTSASNRRLRQLLTAIRNGTLEPRPEFQRRLVWTTKDKNLFISTVLEGLPFPEVYIAAGKVDSKTGEGTELLVDGQQRITTLYQYFTGSKDLKLAPGMTAYADLKEADQLEFLEYKVVIRDLGSLSPETVRRVFERINSTSYGLNAMELNNSRYGGAFKQLSEWLAEQPLLGDLGVFSANDIRRMNDVRYCTGLLASVLGPYFNRDKEIESFLSRFNEEVPEEEKVKTLAERVLSTIAAMNFPRGSRPSKKADFFTLFVELYGAIRSGCSITASSLRAELDDFYDRVDLANSDGDDDASLYYRASLQASNDRSSRILRGKKIRMIIENCAARS
ncbi:DUF262 domain-containing protein [uncultured Alcanivorax sp.]|jgi:hypothetical protein|uniref:DUF262 domain-containing protein n=1 Tax=uncultured Alcanivorax sp. TaxID=191215 RepID=UPI0030DA2860